MSTDNDDLEPLDPETGVELFPEQKRADCRPATVQNHRYRMKHFLEWCDEIAPAFVVVRELQWVRMASFATSIETS